MNYSHIAQLGRQAAMEKTGQRWLNKLMGKSTPKLSPKPYVPTSPLTSKPGTLRPELKNIADKLGIPEDEYLNIMRGHRQHSPLPGAQRMKRPPATPDSIRSAIGAGLGTATAVGTGAAVSGGYGPGGEKSNELIGKYRQWAEPLNRLLRGAFSGKQDKVLPHQATPVPD
jgi:hypothetical protein